MKKKIMVLGLDAGLLLLYFVIGFITDSMLALPTGCVLATLGMECPSCGGTRCVRYLASGQFLKAFQMNPYFFVSIFYLGFLLVLLNSAVLFGKGEKLLKKVATPTAAIIWAVGLIPFTILRNIF
ncbi:MAG: DUF2752 domain-containing protein [Oscillospiraceae bacterium]|nr:DUF2752 domain-containing protein [Oscillospiraceae bacterium]